MSDHGLGFRQIADSKDLLYPMQAMLATVPTSPPIDVQRWKIGPVLNQGAEGACVGFSCKHLLTAQPFEQVHGPSARELYLEARIIDEFDDNKVPEGTSVRAGLNVLKNHDLIESYWWAPDVDNMLRYLSNLGPMVAGTNWYAYDTDLDGRVRFSGSPVGGHAYLITGYDLSSRVFFMVNSWGLSFGHAGEGYITFDDFARQLRIGGVVAGVREKSLS